MNAHATREGSVTSRAVAGDVRRAPSQWRAVPAGCLVAVLLASLAATPGLAATDPTPGADWPAELSEPDPTPDALLDAGRAYLAAGELGPAVEVLGFAAALAPDNAQAHWLLASALTTIRLDHPGEICTWGAWPDVIGDHVVAAVSADPALRSVLLTGAEGAALRGVLSNSLALRVLRDPELVGRAEAHGAVMVDGRPEVVVRHAIRGKKARAAILVETRWYGLDATGGSDDTELDLRPDGTAVWATVHRDADGEKSASWAVGTWAERRGFVQLVRAGEAADVWVSVDGLAAREGYVRYTDRPVDCTRPYDAWAGFEG